MPVDHYCVFLLLTAQRLKLKLFTGSTPVLQVVFLLNKIGQGKTQTSSLPYFLRIFYICGL